MVMTLSKVYLDINGKFLRIFEVSSHSPNKQFSFTWGDLDDATVFEDSHTIKQSDFKEEMPHPQATVPAFAVRSVMIGKGGVDS